MVGDVHATAPPVLIRCIAVVLGTLMVAAAMRPLARGRSGAAPRSTLGRHLLVLAWIARRTGILRRRSDAELLPTRMALAPDSWPARWVARALESGQAREAATAAATPDLGDLIAGVRLLAGTIAIAPLLLASLVIGAAELSLGLAAFVAAALIPDLTLALAARRAVRSGERDAAAVVDMLAATTSAGLTLPEAMVMTAGHAPPAAAAVLRAAAVRGAIGEEPRDALSIETRRYGVQHLTDVAQAVERHRRLGVPLGAELVTIADRLRAEQRARALQRAAKRGPLGTLIVVLVIAPLCLAAVIACLVGGLIVGGGLSSH